MIAGIAAALVRLSVETMVQTLDLIREADLRSWASTTSFAALRPAPAPWFRRAMRDFAERERYHSRMLTDSQISQHHSNGA